LVPSLKTPRELSTKEVEELVEKFVKAALRAKIVGFDCVEVHGTHGYLITQFLSPLTNKKTDKYGADRDLFVLDVMWRIKEYCGKSYPVIFRLNAGEFVEGGITVEDVSKTVKRLEEVGVDALDVTDRDYDMTDGLPINAILL